MEIQPNLIPSIFTSNKGAGNSVFPLLAANENPNLNIVACDYSSKAVEVVKVC